MNWRKVSQPARQKPARANNIFRGLKGRVNLDEPLKKHTTFKIGGPAKYFIEPKDRQDLRSLLNLAKRHKLKIYIIGAGSNILANDEGLNAAVVKLSSPNFSRLSIRGNRLEAGAGISLPGILKLASQRGLSGLEWLAGIPGTLGGALVMNAGGSQPGTNIGDLVEKAVVMDYNGKIKTLPKAAINFSYRNSGLDKYIILGAILRLFKKSKQEVNDSIRDYLIRRRDSQDLFHPSAGCAFKNPSQNSAGRLIDLCGLKGKAIGGASVSLRHANFLINSDNATAKQVLSLICLIQKNVKNKFKLTLEPEIKIW